MRERDWSTNDGLPWSSREVESLRKAVAAGVPDELLAERFARSIKAVRSKRLSINECRCSREYGKRWTTAEDAELLARYGKGESASDIAKRLGRPPNSIIGRWHRLMAKDASRQ